MKTFFRVSTVAAAIVFAPLAYAQSLDADAINAADGKNLGERANIIKLQVLLDRAHFSPGVIDGRLGDNVKSALRSFRNARGLPANDEELDDAVRSELGWSGDQVIGPYKLTQDDLSGPFTKQIPEDLEAKSTLEHLGYVDAAEKLAERFHMDQDFLEELNPGGDLRPGSEIHVAEVLKQSDVSQKDLPKADRLEVDRDLSQLFVYDDKSKLVAAFPATVGSDERPSPEGELVIKGVAKNPKYTYSRDLNFSGVKSDTSFKIAPGPNNPVGTIWIDLNKDGYGIHGSPDPSRIGKAASHGCVRLSNWDAEKLAKMVHPGMKVLFR